MFKILLLQMPFVANSASHLPVNVINDWRLTIGENE